MNKDMNITLAHTIRHPVDIPLQVKAIAGGFCHQPGRRDVERGDIERECADAEQAACVELAFHFPMMISVGVLLSICIPSINDQEELHGQVTWLAHSTSHGFIIGMSFQNEGEAFRMRMLEQLCHIEDYRQRALETEGRDIDPQQAACEWIDRHAAAFPVLHIASVH